MRTQKSSLILRFNGTKSLDGESVAAKIFRNEVSSRESAGIAGCATDFRKFRFGRSGRSNVRFEGLLRLHRESDRNVGGTVELLENLVAEHAPILALGPGTGRQLDAAIAGMTGGAHQIGFFHADVMPRLCSAFQPPAASHFLRKASCFGEGSWQHKFPAKSIALSRVRRLRH
jgi:hypothetical protein